MKSALALMSLVTAFSAVAATPDEAAEVFSAVAAAANLPVQTSLVIGEAKGGSAHSTAGGKLLKPCIVTISPQFLATLNRDAIAGVFGHELSHCALKHEDPLTSPRASASTAWTQEYAADALGVVLATRAGFNGLAGLSSVVQGSPESITHPSGEARLAALSGQPQRQRELLNAPAAKLVLLERDGHLIIGTP